MLGRCEYRAVRGVGKVRVQSCLRCGEGCKYRAVTGVGKVRASCY